MMANDKSLSYYDRLKKFGLTTLETRRLRGDLIEVYKLFKGYDNVDFNVFFKLSSTHLRGHELKIYKPRIVLLRSSPPDLWYHPGSFITLVHGQSPKFRTISQYVMPLYMD